MKATWSAIALSLVWLASVAGAHVPVEVQIVRPQEGEVVPSTDLEVVLQASETPLSQQVQVKLQLDGVWVDPTDGSLVENEPLVPLTIDAGSTAEVAIEAAEPGEHTLAAVFTPHPGHEPVSLTRSFTIEGGGLPTWAGLLGAGVLIVLFSAFLIYYLPMRRRR